MVKPKRLGELKERGRGRGGRRERERIARWSNVTASRNAAISHPYLICQPPRVPRGGAAATTLRFLCPPTRFSRESPNLSDPKDRSLPPLPIQPKTNREDGGNLNSLLGLLIPRIDAEFRAQPLAPPPARSRATITSSFFRVLSCSHDPHEASRAGKSAAHRSEHQLGRNYDHRASERAKGHRRRVD